MDELYETVSLDEMIPLVAIAFPEINKGIIKYYLREAIITFARQTGAIQRKVFVELQRGVRDYIIGLPDHHKISEVSNVSVDGCCLTLIRDCDCCHDGGYFYKNRKITLCVAPQCGGELIINVCAIPSRTSCNIDAEVVELWGDVIASATMARIMKSPDRRWRSLVESRNQEREYRRGVLEAQKWVQKNGVADKVVHIGSFPKTRDRYALRYT